MSSLILVILLHSGLTTLSSTLRDLYCQPGWSQYGSRCFRIFTTKTSWDEAENNCVNMGGHLASVHSVNEYTFIQDLVNRADGSNPLTWLGATDVVQERVWVWTDGSAFDYYDWCPGQPDNRQLERCLEINFAGHWNDRPCSYLNPSACAKRADPSRIRSVMRLKIISKKELMDLDIEELLQMVKQRLMDSGMPRNITLRLKNIYKKPT